MRIAVCFSGQIRTGVEASENIKHFLGDLLPYCDFFIHTWNINTWKNYCYYTNIHFKKDEYVSDYTFNKIYDIYDPKKVLVEKLDKKIENDIGFSYCFISLWHSFNKSIELKKQYEKENNFKYDYVVKLRFDLIFPLSRKLSDDLKYINDNNIIIDQYWNPNIEIENMVNINDVYFLGNSNNIDIVANYVNNIEEQNGAYGYPFLKYLDSFNIIYDTNKYKPDYGTIKHAIYRTECLKYSPVNEYDKCLDCSSYYYGPPLFKHNKYSGGYLFELNRKYKINDMFDRTKKYYTTDLEIKDGYENLNLF